METTNEKTIMDTHIKKKQSKHNTKDSKSKENITKEERKKKTKKDQKKNPKRENGNKYILIHNYTVNGFSAPRKRHSLAEWTQKQD